MCYQLSRFACGHIENRRLKCENSKTPFRALNQLLFKDRGCDHMSDVLDRNCERCPGCKHRDCEEERCKNKQSLPIRGAQVRRANTVNMQKPRPQLARSNTVQLRVTDYPTNRNSFDMMITAHQDYNPQNDHDKLKPQVLRRPSRNDPVNLTSDFAEVPLNGGPGRRPSRTRSVRPRNAAQGHKRSQSSKGSLLDRVLTHGSESSSSSGRSMRDRLKHLHDPSEESFVSAEARKIERQTQPGHSNHSRHR